MPRKISTTTYSYKANGLTKTCIAVTTVLAMLAYSAFPLAVFLNKPYFWHGLVSGLTEPGQPHSWFFGSIDIAASLFGVMFFSYLSRREDWDKVQAVALRLVVIACFAEFLTDIFTLPANFSTTGGIPTLHYISAHPSLVIHVAASFVNSTAFVVSFGLWVWHRRHTKSESLFREFVFAVTLSIGVFGSIVGYIYPSVSPTLQRIFILCYCYWFIAFPYDSLATKRRRTRR